jgi:CHASE3 domain sensor protein
MNVSIHVEKIEKMMLMVFKQAFDKLEEYKRHREVAREELRKTLEYINLEAEKKRIRRDHGRDSGEKLGKENKDMRSKKKGALFGMLLMANANGFSEASLFWYLVFNLILCTVYMVVQVSSRIRIRSLEQKIKWGRCS